MIMGVSVMVLSALRHKSHYNILHSQGKNKLAS